MPLSGELSKCSTCFLELPNIVVNNVVLIISNASIYHLGLMASNDVIALIWAVYGKIDKDHSGFDVKKENTDMVNINNTHWNELAVSDILTLLEHSVKESFFFEFKEDDARNETLHK